MKLLKPLSVPWMVSPSVPRLTLVSEEDGLHCVKFCGFLGFEDAVGGSSNSVLVDDGTLLVNPDEASARYQLISLSFESLGWLRRSPQFSDREIIQESAYDWSSVLGCIQTDESVDDWMIRYQRDWAKTRVCPNPGVYVVENSDWDVGPDKARYNLKHYLILGDSIFIEILARNCDWISEGHISR